MDWLLEQALTGLTPRLGTPEQRILQSIGEPGNRIRLSPRGVQIAYPDLSGEGKGRLANPLNRFLSSAQYGSRKQTGWEEFLAPGKQGRNFIAANNATLDSYLTANPQYQGLFNPGTPQYQDFQRRLYGAMSTGAAIRNLAEVTGAPFSQPLGVRPFSDSKRTPDFSPFSAERQLYLQGGGDIFQNPQNYFKNTEITPAQNGEYRITRRDGREIFFNPVFGYVRQGGNYTRTLSPEGMELLQSFGIQPGQTIQDFARALNEGGTISTRDIGDLARQGDAFTLAPLTQMQLAAARQQFNADLDQEGAQFIDGQRLFNTSNVNLYRGKEALRPMAEAIVRLAEKRRRAEPGRNLPQLTEEQAFQVAAQLVHSTYGLEDGIPAQNRIKSLKGLSRVSHDLFEPLQDYGNELQFTNAVLQEMKAPSIHPRTLGQIASSQMQPVLADRPGPSIDYRGLDQTGELSPGDVERLRTEVTRVINTMNPVAPNSAYSDRHSPLIGSEDTLGPATLKNLTNQGAGTLSPALEQLFPETFNRSTDSKLERMLQALRVAPHLHFIPTVDYWGNPLTYPTGSEIGDSVSAILRNEPAALSDYRRLGIQKVDTDARFNEEQAAFAGLYKSDPYAAVQEGAGGAGNIYDLMDMREQQALAEANLQDPYDPTSRVPRNAIGFDAAYLNPAQINPVLTTRRQGGRFIKNEAGQNIGYEGGKIIEGPHTPLPSWMIADKVTGTVAGRQALFNPVNQPSLLNDPGLIANFTDYRNFFNPQRPSSRLGPAEFVPDYWEPPSSRSIKQMQDDWFNASQQWEDRSDDVADPRYLDWSDDIDRRVLADRELAARLQADNDQMFAEVQRERAFYEAQNANPRLLYNPSFQQLAQSNPEMAIAALERAWPGGSHLVRLNPNYNEEAALKAARALMVGDYGIQNMPGGLNLTDQEKLLAMRDGSNLQNLIDNPYFGLPSGQEAIAQSRFETKKGGSVDLSKKPWLIPQLRNRIVNTPGGTIPWLISNELPQANQSEFQELGSTRVAMPRNNDIFVRFSQVPAVESVYSAESNRPFLSPQELLNQAWPLLGTDEIHYRSLQPINPNFLHRLNLKNTRGLHAAELQAIQSVAETREALRSQLAADNAVLVNGSLRLPWQKLGEIDEAVKAAIPMPFSMGPQKKTLPVPNASIPSIGIPYAQRQPWAGGPTGLTEIPYVSPMARDYTIPSQSATPLEYVPQYRAVNEANQEWLNLLAQPREEMTSFNLGTPPGDPEYLPIFRRGESGSLNIDRSVPQAEFTNAGFSTAGNRPVPVLTPDWDRTMLPLNLKGQSSQIMRTTGQAMQPSLLTPQAQAYLLSPSAQARATLGNTNFSRFDTYNVDPSDPLKVIESYQSRLNAIMGTGEAQRELMIPQQNQQNAPVIQAPRKIITQPATGQAIQAPRKIITQPATGQVVQPPINVWAGSGDNAQFSNFASRPFTIDVEGQSRSFQSPEHYYQAMKALEAGSRDLANQIKNAPDGFTAKKLGSQVRLTPQQKAVWDSKKVDVLLQGMRASFNQNPGAAQQLLATGNTPFTHSRPGASSQDFWSTKFPELLSTVRSELSLAQAQAPEIVAPTQAIQYASPIQYPSLGRKAYAGIGRRTTPPDVQQLMTQLAGALENQGYVLRSGGAPGADQAFQRGVSNPANMEIWLPFNRPYRGVSPGDPGMFYYGQAPGYQGALEMAAKFNPSESARDFYARNAMQVLGPNLSDPSSVVYAWTPEGREVGGTRIALNYAKERGIPIRNLGIPTVRQEIEKQLGVARPVNLPQASTVTQYATPKSPRQIQLPMNYGYQGMARPEVTQYLQQTGRPLTTMGAVDAGLRTGTTRSSLPPGLAVGDLISITGGGLPAVQAQVDAILNQGEFNPATRAWSIREGWQPSPGGKIGEQVFGPNAKQVIWTPVDRPIIVRGINSPVDYAKAQVYGNQNIALGFTANSMRNQNGALVMGAGNAKQAALADPSAPIRFGAALRDQGTPIGGDFGLIEDPGSNFVAIQTKRDWRQPTPMDLLENVTLPAVQQWSRSNPGRLLITPPWGIGQGGANPDQVAQLMSRLPANVMIADPGNTPAFRRNLRFLFM